MNINEIMERDIANEDRRQIEREARTKSRHADTGDSYGLPWVRLAIVCAVALAALGAAFMAGAAWQATDIRKCDDAFNCFLLERARQAAQDVAAMTNTELLRTERGCVLAEPTNQNKNRKD